MKVTILDAHGNRKERRLSGKATLSRVIGGSIEHLTVTVAKSRVERVQRWLTNALSTIQRWDQDGHVWFDVEDKTRDSTTVEGHGRRYQSVGSVLTNRTKLYVEQNKPR